MEIAGQRLFFPPNFRFFHRLPARFEILVIGQGASRTGGTVFEVEIAGQRLALPSRVALVPGRRYELEKISEFEFRIVEEKTEREKNAPGLRTLDQPDATRVKDQAPALPPPLPFSLGELAVFRLLEENGGGVREQNRKFLFDFVGEIELRGLFHPHSDGTYTLFVSGTAARRGFTAALADELKSLGVSAIRIIESPVFERLAAGAIDLSL